MPVCPPAALSGPTLYRLRCPSCMIMPVLVLLQKIANHPDLIRPDALLAQENERKVCSTAALAAAAAKLHFRGRGLYV